MPYSFLLLIAALASATPASAFDTVTHDAITKRITDACGYDELGGQLLNLGNRWADNWNPGDHGGEGQVPPAHCDDESFVAASRRIRGLLERAACGLLACDRGAALEALGRALHPVEDFFSHSNLIEIEEHEQRRYAVDFLDLAAPTPGLVCDPRTHLTNYPGLAGLTSGYFSAGDLDWKPAGKCSHRDLNKDKAAPPPADSSDPALSARLHPAAVAQAVSDGTTFLGDIAEPKVMQLVAAAEADHGSPMSACLLPNSLGLSQLVTDVAISAAYLKFLHVGGACPMPPMPPMRTCPALSF